MVNPTPRPVTALAGQSISTTWADSLPPGQDVPGPANDVPVRRLNPEGLRDLGVRLDKLWMQYRSDRRIAELRWLRNERQYLGIYDPDVDKELMANRSRAYPRITRVKCISVLSRLMNLMFPGDERNWEIRASPDPDMDPADVKQAIQDQMKKDQENGTQPTLNLEYVMSAVQALADKRAEQLCELIDDQLQEIGGDQTLDYVQLNRKVLQSGVIFGLGLLKGPYAQEKKKTTWSIGPDGTPTPSVKTVYMPVFKFLKIWDFYPDMSAKDLDGMDGHFERHVMSRSQVKALGKRADFFEAQIDRYLKNNPVGNYRQLEFEWDLRAMGVKVNVNEQKAETSKYEVIVWCGKVSGSFLQIAGIDVPEDKLSEEIDAEVWMIDANVICAKLNPWESLGVDVKMLHYFLFDEDDTSPVGFGLPNAVRDSQMGIAAATRMLMDNASVVCGPNLELNTDLLRPDQDLASTSAYKIWYRMGEGIDAQWPAVRPVTIDSHLQELTQIIDLFMKFADMETFVGPATGGDVSDQPSEPMRTMGGASMIRGDAALPFKDIVRSFDRFTESAILSLVRFNEKFNPEQTQEGDYNVIARGATTLIAKEMRAASMDQLAMSLKPEEAIYVDMQKMVDARFRARDMGDMLVSDDEVARRQQAQSQAQAAQEKQQADQMEATTRKLLSDAFKNVAQGQKNSAAANADAVNTALALLEAGVNSSLNGGRNATASGPTGPQGASTGNDQAASPDAGDPGNPNPDVGGGLPPTSLQGPVGGMPAGPGLGNPGGGQGL